jgi:two-component system CheB/CheR fusion protein
MPQSFPWRGARHANPPEMHEPPMDEDDSRALTAHAAATAQAPLFHSFVSEGAVSIVPMVAIGASAGGVEALRQLFSEMSANTGMAFVVIQHPSPDAASLLTRALGSDQQMQVVDVADGMRAQPNRIHVMPGNADLTVSGGMLLLAPRHPGLEPHMPINGFFRALAADQKGSAIGVVLSGSGSDGCEGLRAIKAAGGFTFAQDSASAQFRGMPDNAVAAGVVDQQLAPRAIARALTELSREPYLTEREASEPPRSAVHARELGSLKSILNALAGQAHIDFSGYKRSGMLRRIARRMALRHLGSLEAYASSLEENPSEAVALAEDMLVHVTSFFRDPAAFQALSSCALPALLGARPREASIRVWVPGCSTGEEAYTLVMCLLELLERQAPNEKTPGITLFGSDLSDGAVQKARAGAYTDAELGGVDTQRLERFFERAEGGYRVCRQVRDSCVFVKHDLTRDPPFAKLDLISCRNVLIDFASELQRRILPMLHQCLNPSGLLFLGSGEAVTGFEELFEPLDKEHRLFVKAGRSPRLAHSASFRRQPELERRPIPASERRRPAREAQTQADHFLLSRYAPPGVVVNERLEVVQFRGHTGAFLESPPGQPQANLLRMAREGLVAQLREALEKARSEHVSVRRPGVRIDEGTRVRLVDLEVVPLPVSADGAERYYLVLFNEAASPPEQPPLCAPAAEQSTAALSELARRLRAELSATKDYLQVVIGEHQEASLELSTLNEELQSANEELQSTNQELESAKQDLQSTNTGLTSVNGDLQERNREMDRVANDLENVLESVQIPVIIVDLALRVRRFTPSAQHISSLLPVDIGRSIEDVKLKLDVQDVSGRIRKALDSNTLEEWEVQGPEGRWFRLQIRPYRASDRQLDGAILSFIDVNALKRAAQEAEAARDYARGIVETAPIPLCVLDEDLCVVSANSAFYDSFDIQFPAAEGLEFFKLAGGAWEVPSLRAAVQAGLTERTRFRDMEIQRQFPGVGCKDLCLAGCPIASGSGELMLLLVIEDVTEQRMLECSEEEARVEAEQANRAKDLFLATLSHELRTPLSTILISAQMLRRIAGQDAKIQKASAAIERAVGNQTRLIDDLLDISRIVSGKLMLDLQAVDLRAVVQDAVDVARPIADAKGIQLELAIDEGIDPVLGDPARLQQVVANILNNSIKFTPRGGRITVQLQAAAASAEIAITDTGIGIAAEVLPRLFDRFFQAEGSMTRAHGGLGLGLAIVQHLVTIHGGVVHAESAGEGRGGATFRIKLPVVVSDALQAGGARKLSGGVAGVKVLLVEDDADTRESFASMLEALGAQAQTAASASQGLALVESFRPQVILCDIAMPGEDGFAFIRALRGRGSEHGGLTPIAALTALASEADRRRSLSAGFQMHLCKPIDAVRLTAAVGTLAVWDQVGSAQTAG